MDYITRRDVAKYQGARSIRIGGRSGLPRLSALGPRICNRSTLLVPIREVQLALEDTQITLAGELPDPIEKEYPASEALDLIDAKKVEALLDQTGLTADDIKSRSNAFFATLLAHPRQPRQPV